MVTLAMSNHRFNRTATLEQPLERGSSLALVTDEHFNFTRMMLLPTKSLVYDCPCGFDATQALNLSDCRLKGRSIIGIAMHRSDAHNPIALGRGGNHNLAAELVAFVRFAFADALDFWRMHALCTCGCPVSAEHEFV